MRRSIPILIAAILAASVPAAEGEPAARPLAQAAVQAWIDDLAAGRYAGAADLLPPELRLPPPAEARSATNPRRTRAGILSRLAGMDGSAARELAGLVIEAVRLAGAVPADGPPRGGWQGMMPRMAAQAATAAIPRAILAAGLETRQTAVLETLWSAHAGWVAGAPLGDEAVRAAVAARLQDLATALAAAPADDEDARAGVAIDGMIGVLAACGLDVHGALASAKAQLESEQDGSAVVVLGFDAYGRHLGLPLRVAWTDGAWRLEADSPLRRWMDAGPGMGGPPRPDRRDDGAPPAADETRPPAGGF